MYVYSGSDDIQDYRSQIKLAQYSHTVAVLDDSAAQLLADWGCDNCQQNVFYWHLDFYVPPSWLCRDSQGGHLVEVDEYDPDFHFSGNIGIGDYVYDAYIWPSDWTFEEQQDNFEKRQDNEDHFRRLLEESGVDYSLFPVI